MFSRKIAMASLAAVIAISPINRVAADGSDFAAGLIGGLIGGAIIGETQRSRKTTTRYVKPRMSTATRQANKQTQHALNYFGYPAGTPDGVLGRKSRAAVSSLQATLRFPVTGKLNTYEREFLVQSYYRAKSNPTEARRIANQSPQGARAILVAYRNQELGVTPQQAQHVQPKALRNTQRTGLQAGHQTGQQGAGTVTRQVSAKAPAAATTQGLIPNFFGDGDSGRVSLASHCNTVSLLTNSNGGFTTLASMSDPQQALSEQFCLARTYAIAQGEEAARGLQGVTMAQMEQKCAQFAPAMKGQIAALSLKPAASVIQDVSAFVLKTGMSPVQLAGSAKVCLSVGYRTDNTDVALGSALLLTALGEQAYAELLGHHLSQGFGTSKRADLALAWYEMGIIAAQNGTTAVFAPGQAERTDLIRKAAFQITGPQTQAATPPLVQPTSILPTFDISG